MKSLRYKLLGLPVTLEDLLDYSRRSRPQRVKVDLGVWRFYGELDVYAHLAVRLEWEFGDHTVICEKVLGRVEGAWIGSPEAGVAMANRRLEELGHRLAGTGAEVIGANERFVPSPPWVAPRAGDTEQTGTAGGGPDRCRSLGCEPCSRPFNGRAVCA